jgi:hypothetical protein
MFLFAPLDFFKRLIALTRFRREIVIAKDLVDLWGRDGS